MAKKEVKLQPLESGLLVEITEDDWKQNHSNIETFEEYRKVKFEEEVELVKKFLESKEQNNG